MSWTTCPICDHRNPRTATRCTACGADFSDPDVRAMAGADAAPAPGLAPAVDALSTARFLGVSLDGLADGHALRRLGGALAIVFAIGFLIPSTADYHRLHAAWSLLDGGPAFALLLPMVAALLAVVVAFARLPAPAAGGALALVGLAGLISLPTLGRFGGAPEAIVPLHALGLALTGGALIGRLARPGDRTARHALIAGAVLMVGGLFWSPGDGAAFPLELGGAAGAGGAAPGKAWFDALSAASRNPFVLFTGAAVLVPAFAALGCAALAWPAGDGGPWDRSSLPLRALGALVVLAPAVLAAELAFNMSGWTEHGYFMVEGRFVRIGELMSGAVIGRLRMGVLGTGYAIMAAFGLAAAYLARTARR